MKREWMGLVMATLTLVATCATAQTSTTQEVQEFRRQVNESMFVNKWGYELKEVRFSADKQQVLTVFNVPGTNCTEEVIFKRDEFGRYTGAVYGYGSYLGAPQPKRSGFVRVVFPPTQKMEKQWEQECRKQLAENEAVKKRGYAVKELRFSDDKQKVLVVFTPPEGSQKETERDGFFPAPPYWGANETVLERDPFGRYRGRLFGRNHQQADVANPKDGLAALTAVDWITVDVPEK